MRRAPNSTTVSTPTPLLIAMGEYLIITDQAAAKAETFENALLVYSRYDSLLAYLENARHREPRQIRQVTRMEIVEIWGDECPFEIRDYRPGSSFERLPLHEA